jgi:hypothetical protein
MYGMIGVCAKVQVAVASNRPETTQNRFTTRLEKIEKNEKR